ncbi:MAG: ImmA/IrrE family metallo-endopeptidase [Anaerotruncus sp.]|nr:ImmA/IrrE family metallo-endopeptidase [Anaerotruncus sp.]
MTRIRALVEKLVEQYRTNDPFTLCSDLGIEILTMQLPPSIRGFYVTLLHVPFIYLNQGLSGEQERRAVCAHELGHALLHQEYNSLFLQKNTEFVTERYEKEANLFAGYLLLDGAFCKDCRCNGWTLEQISRYVALPEEVVSHCIC